MDFDLAKVGFPSFPSLCLTGKTYFSRCYAPYYMYTLQEGGRAATQDGWALKGGWGTGSHGFKTRDQKSLWPAPSHALQL